MDYYTSIKNILIDNEINKKVKDYSKNKSELQNYYNVGKLIVEAQGGEERAKYGNQLIKDYSKKLIGEFKNSKYSERNLMNMKKYYLVFKNEKVNALRSQLSWTHYRELLTIKNFDEIIYYIDIYIKQNLSYRELKKEDIGQIKFYMNYVDKNIKSINHDKTIGVILCKKENELVLKYTSDDRIYSREYLLV